MTIAISPLSTNNPLAKRILVVDDDSSVLLVVARALDEYDLTTARDGVEALAKIPSKCDLLITDFLMPDMTGDELIARLRERQPHLKALVITGHVETLDREAPDWWRAERHLSKPFRIKALRDAVETLIGQGTGGDHLARS